MTDAATTVSRTISLQPNPADRYGEFDSEQFEPIASEALASGEYGRHLDLSDEVRELALELAHDGWRSAGDVVRERPDLLSEFRRTYVNTFAPDEQPLVVTDVVPDSPILSDQPFSLIADFRNDARARVVIATVSVTWAGEPFVVEQEVDAADDRGSVVLRFGKEYALPVGPVEFVVDLWREDGAQATFRRGAYVLPSNPLSLSLGPAGARVTGGWSARGDYRPASDTFHTEVEITIANGDPSSVSMNRRVNWAFWDGPVGSGTRIESGSFNWSSSITVGANSVWRGTAWFSSPRGSGIFRTYDRKEDMAISISMSAADGRVITGEITARVLLSYGVNIIKVGDFGAMEHVDLYDAVDEMQDLFEQRDITIREVDRRIINDSLAGSYTVLNSENEFRDMLEDWSCRNDRIDVFVVQDFNWSGFNGFAGGIPGPASKGGRSDGVAADKTGFTDSSGTDRLRVTTLGQLIGHEVGHYLGLPHKETTNNLMRSNTGNRGPALDYAQYRLMFPHGFVFYE